MSDATEGGGANDTEGKKLFLQCRIFLILYFAVISCSDKQSIAGSSILSDFQLVEKVKLLEERIKVLEDRIKVKEERIVELEKMHEEEKGANEKKKMEVSPINM